MSVDTDNSVLLTFKKSLSLVGNSGCISNVQFVKELEVVPQWFKSEPSYGTEHGNASMLIAVRHKEQHFGIVKCCVTLCVTVK